MKKFKLMSVLALTALTAGALVACGGGDDPVGPVEGKNISLVLSASADQKDLNMVLAEDFKAWRKAEGDPNTYTIEFVEHGEDKVDSEITDWTTGPDVYGFASDKIQGLFQKGALASLKGDFKDFVTTNNDATAITNATFNGQVYGFPYTGDNTYYLQYDKSVFSDEDVKSVENILKRCNEVGTKFAYNMGEGFYGMGAMFTYGADYSMKFADDGQISKIEANFDSAAGLKAGKAMLKISQDPAWIDQGNVIPGPDTGVLISVAGTWSIKDAKESLGDNYGCAPMPTVTVDGDTKPLGCFVGGKLFGVNPQRSAGDADRLNAAYLLGQFLSDAQCQEKRFDRGGIAPCNLKTASLSKVTEDMNIKTLVKQNTWGHGQGAVPGEAWSAPRPLVDGMKDGTVTEETLPQALKTFNETIINSK